MGKAIASAAGVLALLGAAFTIDARYWRVEAGEKAVAAATAAVDGKLGKLTLAVEELRLKNELATARARVQFLGTKARPTADEREEIEFVRSQIALQQKQLLEVQAKR